MNFVLNAVLTMSAGMAAIAGWIRMKKMDPAFYPFIWLMTAGLLNEVTGWVMVHGGYSHVINFNMYTLAGSLLLLWQFESRGLFKSRRIYRVLQCLLTGAWMPGYIIAGNRLFKSYFILANSTVIVVMCIEQINREILRVRKIIYPEPVFLICMGC